MVAAYVLRLLTTRLTTGGRSRFLQLANSGVSSGRARATASTSVGSVLILASVGVTGVGSRLHHNGCDATRRGFVVAVLEEIEADIAFLKQPFGCPHIHCEKFGFGLVPANLSGLREDIVGANLDSFNRP